MAFTKAEPIRLEYHKDSKGDVLRIFLAYYLYDSGSQQEKYVEYWIDGNDAKTLLASKNIKADLEVFIKPKIKTDYDYWINKEMPTKSKPPDIFTKDAIKTIATTINDLDIPEPKPAPIPEELDQLKG